MTHEEIVEKYRSNIKFNVEILNLICGKGTTSTQDRLKALLIELINFEFKDNSTEQDTVKHLVRLDNKLQNFISLYSSTF